MEKAIFIDLDGTLMQKDLTVSLRNIESIKNAINYGFRVVIVSGRPIRFVNYIASKIDDKIDTIGFNGAYATNLIEHTIHEANLISLYEIFENNNISAIFKSIDHIYANRAIIENFVYPISDEERIQYTENCSADQIINHKIYKILGIYNHNEAQVNELINPFNMTKAFYGNKGFELTHHNANKGDAIKLYCLKNNVSLSDSYMFGDDVNDVSMFSLGGKNMAMANANENIKEYATTICECCEEDGVGKMIERIIEGESV